jgi:hypothetical protein
MNLRHIVTLVPIVILLHYLSTVTAENIDPDNDGSQYAYGENIGWLNFEPVYGPGVTVTKTLLTGFIWAENIGWIHLSPSNHGGVINDGTGDLSGYAWAENVGWINFNPQIPGDPTDYGVRIDGEGNFDGWAWGENVGWIHFQSTAPVAYKVKVCMVTLADLNNFISGWLEDSNAPAADLDNSGDVNLKDYNILASYWLSYCPENWPL